MKLISIWNRKNFIDVRKYNVKVQPQFTGPIILFYSNPQVMRGGSLFEMSFWTRRVVIVHFQSCLNTVSGV